MTKRFTESTDPLNETQLWFTISTDPSNERSVMTKWFTDSTDPLNKRSHSWPKDSLIQLIHWTRNSSHDQMIHWFNWSSERVITKRFTDSNTDLWNKRERNPPKDSLTQLICLTNDPPNERRAHLSHDQMIHLIFTTTHRFKHTQT